MLDKKNKDAEKLLLQVKSMAEILDNIGAYVFAKDLDGKYIYINSDVANLFQMPVDDIIGKDDSHFFDLGISDELRLNDLKVIKHKVAIESEENNSVKSTGKIHTYKTIKKPLFNDKNQVIGLIGISTDITTQKTLETENKNQKNLLDVILNNVDAYIYMKDSNRTFKYVNSRVAELFGLPAKDIIGKRDIDVIPQEFADHFWQTDKLVFEQGEKIVINETSLGADNKIHHYLSIKVPCDFEENNKTLIGFSTDVTELYHLKEKFKKLANTDELTGLYNRRYFFDNAKHEFNRAKRNLQALGVISIDIDHFKDINDQYGHPMGDKALLKITDLIIPTIRTEDILARIGGEEFLILLPHTPKEQCQKFAERLRKLIDTTPISITNNIQLAIKISLGVAVIKTTDTCFEDMYARSDVALYKAKSLGRNQVVIID
ncbi:sensor domain-containing diguanylate cyclase [Cognaticolwellia mytili]|uniref:sensor domain-containing diguanylate cyclase n=1 Tax=Cognaticolwellia mytili TaxID=1888913 RepID=UPI000A16CC07|nr:sensor domain-containing diguanylate cyclase [Cognaticolwellia mytili]